MTLDGAKRAIDATARVAENSKVSAANRLARFDREVDEMLLRIGRWERYSKAEMEQLKAHYTEVRTRFENAMTQARLAKAEASASYRRGA